MFYKKCSSNGFNKELTMFETSLVKGKRHFSGVISLIYKLLNEREQYKLTSFQLTGNKDCQSCSLPGIWPNIWLSQQNYSWSQYIRLQHFKILSRWYITPEHLSHFNGAGDTNYSKGCGQTGSLFHCWWLCPVVQKYWTYIFHQIHQITSLSIPFTPEVISLDYWHNSSIPDSSRELILLLLAAKCVWSKL